MSSLRFVFIVWAGMWDWPNRQSAARPGSRPKWPGTRPYVPAAGSATPVGSKCSAAASDADRAPARVSHQILGEPLLIVDRRSPRSLAGRWSAKAKSNHHRIIVNRLTLILPP
jgi:hypothetical protein